MATALGESGTVARTSATWNPTRAPFVFLTKRTCSRSPAGSEPICFHCLSWSTSSTSSGTVQQNFGVGPAWKQPDATHIVKYFRKDTGTQDLEGRVACKLAAENYGRDEWWLLLDPVEQQQA